MFEPVSPSGTGKTLRALTCSWLAWSQARAERRPIMIWSPETSRSGSCSTFTGAGSVLATVSLEKDALDVDVDGDDVQTERLLHRVLDGAHEVVGDFADPRPVLGDDVKLDEDAALAELDLH